MRQSKLFLFLMFFTIGLSSVFAQDTEFWFVAPQSGISTLNNGGFVFTNTSPINSATVTITYYKSGLTETLNIPPGEGTHHVINQSFSTTHVENMLIDAGNVVPCGIHIESTEKLIAYYFFDAAATKDIFALKGAAALGMEFFVPQTTDGFYINGDPGSGANYSHAFDQIDIVATEDNTTVTVTLTRDCVKEYDKSTGTASADIPAGTYTVTLNKGDAIKYLEKGHGTPNTFNTLGGTKIVSDKPVAVSSTEEVTNHDMVADQIIPTNKTGTLYPIVKAFSDTTLHNPGWGATYSKDRVYIMATKDGTDVYVNLPDGSQQTLATGLNAGEGTSYSMGELHKPPYAISIKTSQPAYCLQTTAQSYHPGGAVLPSIYSVAANKLSFYQFPASAGPPRERNAIFLAFRDTCEKYFEIEYGGTTQNLMTLAGIPTTGATPDQMGHIPGISGWSYMRVTLPLAADDKVVTIRNSESVFSLGYFSGSINQHYATLGYLSAFGTWKFDPDTFWRCAASALPITLMGGYAADYKWTLPDSTVQQGPTLNVLKARKPGMYILEMDQEYQILTDTCWIIDMQFQAAIKREPNKPAKIGVPQQFNASVNASLASMLSYEWTFEGGTPSTSTAASPRVVWNITGQKKVTLRLSASGGTGVHKVDCDTTIVMDLMLHEKNIGYFVDQNVNGGKHDGSNWQDAFTTIEEALDKASQGDCVWVAEGNYTPKKGKSYVLDYDSVEVYGGFGAWEADLNERDYHAHKTVMNGNGASTVVFDGSNTYTSGSCGVSRAARVDGFIIRGGTAQDGAGIIFRAGASGTVANSVVKENTATNNGGGVYIEEAYSGCIRGSKDPLLYNVEISHNRAAQGAGIYNNETAFVSVNNTISGNAAPVAAGLHNDGDALLRNTIIWGNITGGKLGNDVTNAGGNPTYTHSNIAGWSNALGKDGGRNIDKNPLFIRKGYDEDNLTLLKDGNYRLAQASPSVNTGYNGFVLAGLRNRTSTELLKPIKATYADAAGLDLGGYARIYDDVVDMGAYEYHPATEFPHLNHPITVGTYPNVTTVPPAGLHYVKGHEDFTITLTPAQGYSLKYVTVTTGSKIQDEKGGVQLTHNADGTVTVVLKEVTEPLNVMLSGISTVGNISIADGYAIWSKEGTLCIQTSKAARLNVYTVTGRLIHQSQLKAGETTVPLAQGLYIVTLDGGKRQKVMIR